MGFMNECIMFVHFSDKEMEGFVSLSLLMACSSGCSDGGCSFTSSSTEVGSTLPTGMSFALTGGIDEEIVVMMVSVF